jgi:hypothetical protein
MNKTDLEAVNAILLRCLNEIGDYFEYSNKSAVDKKVVMDKMDKMTQRLKERKL